MGVGKELKRIRGKQSQQQLSLDFNVARESISAYENERARIPKDIAQKAMQKFDDPDFARTVASEYTAGGWAPALNGPAVIRDCSAVKSRALKETEEAYEAMRKACLDVNPAFIGNFEKEDIKKSLDEASEAVTWINEYMATICRNYHFSWLKTWAGCQTRLIHRGFLRMVKGGKK
jgi:hypothetical protein